MAMDPPLCSHCMKIRSGPFLAHFIVELRQRPEAEFGLVFTCQ